MSYTLPLVAIHCLVYNHEPYLRDCLEGFVMQQTDFPFVAIVHDDASTDGSAAVIREYEERYPQMFIPIYEHQNVYLKGGLAAINEIMNAAIDATGAKYVAMCEGDDYWTDPLKLQKQVDYMETHSDCVICSHKFKKRYMNNELIENMDYSSIFPNESVVGCNFTLEQIYEKFYLQTLCVLYRRSALDEKRYVAHRIVRDNLLFLEIMRNGGRGYIFNSYDGVYRIHDGGIYSGLKEEKRLLDAIDVFEYIYNIFPADFTRVKLFYQYNNYMIFLRTHFSLFECVVKKQYLYFFHKRFYTVYDSMFMFLKRTLRKLLKR